MTTVILSGVTEKIGDGEDFVTSLYRSQLQMYNDVIPCLMITCCDMRLMQIRNQAEPSELIPKVCIRRTKLIGNQLDLLVVYIASCFPLNK